MRKSPVFIVLFLVIAIILFMTLTYQEPSDEYVNLETQFDSYLGKDINTKDKFVNYINELQLDHTCENVKVGVQTQNEERMYQSGVIIGIQDQVMYVVTSNQYLDTSKRQTYLVHDYKDIHYSATLIANDDTYHIMILAFEHFSSDLCAPEIADYMPLLGEIISSVSSKDDIMNKIALGTFVSEQDEYLNLVNMDFTKDMLGSSIYDINLKLVGIVTQVDGTYYVLKASYVYNYLEQVINS